MVRAQNQKQALSRDLIIETANCLIEKNGYRAFTMRTLGAELGVSAMAFYAHFSSREELLGEVCSRFMETMDTDPIPGERWDDTLRRTMASIHEIYRDHPNLGKAADSYEGEEGGLAAHTKKIVMLHLNQGMPSAVFSRAWAIVDTFLSGFFISEFDIALLNEEELSNEAGCDSLEEWELIVRSAYTDEAFQSGVEIIIAGIRSVVAPDPCEWYTPR